jgi:hypothetical protein
MMCTDSHIELPNYDLFVRIGNRLSNVSLDMEHAEVDINIDV